MSKTGSRTAKNKPKPITRQTTKTVKKKKTKIKYSRLLLALIIIVLILYIIINVFKFNIKNIYIKGNTIYSDQQIIELANIENYPSTFNALSFKVENDIKKDIYIKKAKVTKKHLTKIYIEIEENKPLFYDENKSKTILMDKQETIDIFRVPSLINYVPESVYDKLITKMNLIEPNILERISEIKYETTKVDEERFLFTMSDGNYVYINLYNMSKINSYISIIEKIDNKKGVLNLDAGGHFTLFK